MVVALELARAGFELKQLARPVEPVTLAWPCRAPTRVYVGYDGRAAEAVAVGRCHGVMM